GIVSPAILVHEGMAAIAGNGTKRYQRFQQQVTTFHDAWQRFFAPRIRDGLAITEPDFARMPSWTWHEDDVQRVRDETLMRLLQMVAISGLLGVAAWRRLRCYPVS
ncbi:MAG: hypothetical protein RL701_4477, partial [Pseudomonadota bacterium]